MSARARKALLIAHDYATDPLPEGPSWRSARWLSGGPEALARMRAGAADAAASAQQLSSDEWVVTALAAVGIGVGIGYAIKKWLAERKRKEDLRRRAGLS